MPTRMFGVDQIEIADVINDAPIGLLGNVHVETAIPSFHVIQRNLQSARHDSCQRAICIAQDHDSVRLFGSQNLFTLDQRSTQYVSKRGNINAQKMIWLLDIQIIKEHLVQFVVVVLTRVNQDMFSVLFQRAHDTR